MKSPRLKKKDNSSILAKPVLSQRSAFSSVLKTKPYPVSFNVGLMMRYDSQKIKSSNTVSKVLSKPSEYSSPSGIKDFIYLHTVEKTQYHSAVIIQRTWERYKTLKKLFRFLKFAHNIVLIENRFVFYSWFIRLTPPANIAKRIYENVTQYFVDRSVKINEDMRIATFDEFMKTNLIFVRKNLDYSKIIKCIRILNYPTLRKFLSLWSEYSVDQVTVKRCKLKGKLLWRNRDKFDGQFVSFHFWRNYTNFKKHKKFDIALEAHAYIPEWAFYRSTQETKFRMQKAADDRRKMRLLKEGFFALRENSLFEEKLEIKYNNCVKIFMRSTMQKVVRALVNNVVFQKFDHGVLKRLVRAWYHTIDNEIIKKNSIGAFKRRNELKTMNKIFVEWGKYAKQEMARYLKLMINSRNNELKFIRVIYVLQKDRINFLLVESFARWRHLVEMAKKASRFVYWIFNYSQQREFKKYVLDMFRENAGRQIKSKDFWPFKIDTHRMYYNPNKKVGKNAKNAHFWRQIQKLIAKKEPIPFGYPSKTVSSSVYAFRNAENYPLYGDWSQSATSYQVKDLFYRIILLFTHSSMLISPKMNSSNIKDQELFSFREKYNLYDFSSFCMLRDQLESEESERRLTRLFRYQRNYDQLMSLEAHDAAQVFQTNWPVNFTLNEEPRTIFSISSPMKSSEQLKVTRNYQEGKLNTALNESHPFLQPIEQIKSQIIANNRKYLRRPEDVFSNHQKALPSIITSQIPGHRKNSQKHEKIISNYENHVSIVLNPDISNMILKEGEFKMQELKNLKNSAEKEAMKRQRTEDIKVINESKKFRSRQKTINPKQVTMITNDVPKNLPLNHKENIASTSVLPTSSLSSSNLPIEKGIMFSAVSSSFLDDKSNFSNNQKRRIEMIMKSYLEFLNFLIFGSKSAFERVNFELLHMRLIKIIGRLAEIEKQKKLKKKAKPKKRKASKSPNSKSKSPIKPKVATDKKPSQILSQDNDNKVESNNSQDLPQQQPQTLQQQVKLKAGKAKILKKPTVKPSTKSKSQLSKSPPKIENETVSDIIDDSEPSILIRNESPSNTTSPRSKTSLKKKKGKNKKSPSPTPEKPIQVLPVDPNYFPFVKPLAKEEWAIDFFGKTVTNDTSNLSPFEHFIGGKILFQHLKAFLFIEGNQNEVVDHFKREIEWVPDYSQQTEAYLDSFLRMNQEDSNAVSDEEQKFQQRMQERRVVFQTVARLKARAQRKTDFGELTMKEEPENEKPKENVKKEEEKVKIDQLSILRAAPRKRKEKVETDSPLIEISLIQRKFTFATELVGAITSISSFLSPYVLIFYEHAELVDSFTGINELRTLIHQRVDTKENIVVVPEEIVTPKSENEDYYCIEFYNNKFAATTEDIPLRNKKKRASIGLSRNHRRTVTLTPNDLNFEKDSDDESNKKSPSSQNIKGRSKAKRRSRKLFEPVKLLSDNDIELFLCISPYVIPISLLTQMIQNEIEKANEIIAEQSKLIANEESK